METPPSFLRIAVLGSGTGTIARAIAERTKHDPNCRYRVVLILSTSETAGISDVARQVGIPLEIVDPRLGANVFASDLVGALTERKVELLVLAGFMKLLPSEVISAMNGRVINIHPALLPRFGGKGMYGRKVHEAVVAAGETETGATVHWVNEVYDEGAIISQRTVEIPTGYDAEEIEALVKQLEMVLLPDVIDELAGSVALNAPQKNIRTDQ